MGVARAPPRGCCGGGCGSSWSYTRPWRLGLQLVLLAGLAAVAAPVRLGDRVAASTADADAASVWPRYYDSLLRPFPQYDHLNVIPHRKRLVTLLAHVHTSPTAGSAQEDFWNIGAGDLSSTRDDRHRSPPSVEEDGVTAGDSGADDGRWHGFGHRHTSHARGVALGDGGSSDTFSPQLQRPLRRHHSDADNEGGDPECDQTPVATGGGHGDEEELPPCAQHAHPPLRQSRGDRHFDRYLHRRHTHWGAPADGVDHDQPDDQGNGGGGGGKDGDTDEGDGGGRTHDHDGGGGGRGGGEMGDGGNTQQTVPIVVGPGGGSGNDGPRDNGSSHRAWSHRHPRDGNSGGGGGDDDDGSGGGGDDNGNVGDGADEQCAPFLGGSSARLIANSSNSSSSGSSSVSTTDSADGMLPAGGLANIWMFWETPPTGGGDGSGGGKKPGYIELCERTVREKAGREFRVHVLDKRSVRRLLPDLPRDLDALLPGLAQYSDYVRLALLKHYGGLWLDSDIVVTRGLAEVLQRMCGEAGGGDFAGFGCSAGLHNAREACEDNRGRPSNWAMASRAGGRLVTWCLHEADRMLADMRRERRRGGGGGGGGGGGDDDDEGGDAAGDGGGGNARAHHHAHDHDQGHDQGHDSGRGHREYAAFGRQLLRRFFLAHPQYRYYHFPSRCMDRDAHGHIISSSAYVSPSPSHHRHRPHQHGRRTDNGDDDNGGGPRRGCGAALPLLIPLYNTAGHATPAWDAFKKLPAQEILVGSGGLADRRPGSHGGGHDHDRGHPPPTGGEHRGSRRHRGVGGDGGGGDGDGDESPDVEGLGHGGVAGLAGSGPSDSYLARVFRTLLAPHGDLVMSGAVYNM